MADATPTTDNNLVVQEALVGRPMDREGKRWAVTLIREGCSKNRGKRNPALPRYYPAQAVREVVTLSEGAWCNLDHRSDLDRASYPTGRTMDRAAFLSNVREVADGGGRIRADAVLNVVDQRLRENLRNAWDMGRRDYAGLSIDGDARGFSERRLPDGSLVEAVDGLVKVHSVDIVTEAAAGGSFNAILEANMSGTVADHDLLTPEGRQAFTQAVIAGAGQAVAGALREALAEDAAEDHDEGEGAWEESDEDWDDEDEGDWDGEAADEDEGDWDDEDEPDGVTEAVAMLADELEATRFQSYRLQADMAIREALANATGLPPVSLQRAERELGRLADQGALDDRLIESVLRDERDFVGRFMQTNPAGTPATLRTTPQASTDYYDRMLGMVLGQDIGSTKRFGSIREAYFNHPENIGKPVFGTNPFDILAAGRVTYDSGSGVNVREGILSTEASFGSVMADVMHQAMQKKLAELPYNDWRKVVSRTESVTDFRSQRWLRVGMYSNVPSVGEAAPYQYLTSPTSQEATYAISKYGGLETVSIEAIANDQVGALQGIPGRLAYAYGRTLYESILDTATSSNPTCTYDSVALYHSSHGNTGSASLTVAGLYNAQQYMRKMVPYGAPATEYMGERNKIKLLIVPTELEAKARKVLTPSDMLHAQLTAIANSSGAIQQQMDADTAVDPGYFKGSGIDLLVYDKLSADSTSKWYAMGNKDLLETLVVGFFMGKQTPDLFTQDAGTNSGSAFSADVITYKIRGFWGVGILDHRGLRREGA